MGERKPGRLARTGAIMLAAAIAAAGCVSGIASAVAAKPGTLAASGATTTAARVTALSLPASYTPSTRTLREGMTGADVRALQSRLAALKYYPGPIDGVFGTDTLEAVWAFQEVNGLSVDGIVGTASKYALVHPRGYAARYPGQDSTRVEVNLTVRVLVLYRSGQIALISHVSTGGGYWYRCGTGYCKAVTPTGKFRTTVYLAGWIKVPLGEMYNSVFFISTVYAIHGDTYVPVNPVSHGCVRIPMDIAAFFHALIRTPGTEVLIYR